MKTRVDYPSSRYGSF